VTSKRETHYHSEQLAAKITMPESGIQLAFLNATADENRRIQLHAPCLSVRPIQPQLNKILA
jgi:hypothetical protein